MGSQCHRSYVLFAFGSQEHANKDQNTRIAVQEVLCRVVHDTVNLRIETFYDCGCFSYLCMSVTLLVQTLRNACLYSTPLILSVAYQMGVADLNGVGTQSVLLWLVFTVFSW